MKKLNQYTTAVSKERPVKVIQFGGGNFLRGFADWMIDVMNERAGFNGSVKIILSVNKEMAKTLEAQQGLYHVVTNGLVNGKPFREIRLITAIDGAIDPADQYDQFLNAALNPDLQFIISNTTEAGIVFSESDTSDSLPYTFPGKLARLLFHRFENLKGVQKRIIVLPCELIKSNGDQLREIILKYARHWQLPAAFSEWITTNIIFCNTLVDRIVPGFPKENYQQLQEEVGYEDKLMITAEPFHFWAIQPCIDNADEFDYIKRNFPAQQAGLQVRFVKDLTPYQTRKVRILNGAHTVLTPVAYLSGQRFVKESVDAISIGYFIRQAIFNEIIPGLDMAEDELKQFAHAVLERFQNPYIKHELSSIALNSIAKFNVRVLPSILRYREMNNSLPENLMFSWAALICFYKGEWRGKNIALNDAPEVLHFFKEVWKQPDAKLIALKVLANQNLWSQELTIVTGLHESLAYNISKIMDLEKSTIAEIFIPAGQPHVVL